MAGPWEDYRSAPPAVPPWQEYSTIGGPKLEAPNPAAGQSTFDNAAAGAGKFVSDTGLGAKQLVNDMAAGLQDKLKGTSIGNAIDLINAKLGLSSPQQIQQQGRDAITESRKLDAPLMATGAGNAGYIGGALLTAPLIPATGGGMLGAAATGAAIGATQPAVSWGERGTNTALGALSSGATQAGVNAVARVIQPQTPQAVRSLMEAGITPTPGQILGGTAKRVEEAATSVPIVGDFIKGAQNRGIGQLNDAVANRALAPVGEVLPKGISGRDAVDYVGSTLGGKYDALLPKMGAVIDAPFANDVNSLVRMVQSGNMGPQEVGQFMAVLKNNVAGKFQGQQGALTGETLKAMHSDLGSLATNYARDPSFDKRQLGQAIGELQDAVRGMVTRQNPQHAQELNAIDSGYAVFKRMQRAASSVAADDGTFTPAMLQSAVKAMDRSKDKGAFARGDALLQDLSDPAKQLMAPKLADSGTPYRSLLTLLGAGAIGAHELPMLSGVVNPFTLAPLAATPLLYSPWGQKMMAGLLAQRPAMAAPIAGAVQSLGPTASLIAPALTYSGSQ